MSNPASVAALPVPGAPARQDNVLLGIALMIGATLFLASSNALSKHLVATYPVGEVMFVRSFIGFAVCAAFVLPARGLAVFRTARPGAHLARGLSQAVSQTLTVLALGLMPLAGVMAIGFSAPLWAALVAVLVFRERSDGQRWAMLGFGFLGVLIVTRPGVDSVGLGALFALGNAVMYGSVTVAVRSMSKTESAPTLLMWQMAVMAACHAGLLVFGCRLPSLADAGFFLLLGLTTAGAQFLWTRALALAPATAVSPFYYLMLVWGALLGFLFWGEWPGPATLIGALVVMGSGFGLLLHEARLKAGRTGGPVAALRSLRRRSAPPAALDRGAAAPASA